MRIALLSVLAAGCASAPAPDRGPERDLYLAAVSAANAAIRLDEAGEARRWLGAAPEKMRGWEWRHLANRIDTSVAVADVGAPPVRLSFSPDGATIAVAAGNDVVFFDAATLAETGRLSGHEGAVYGAAFSPDGARLVSTARDATIRMWDLATGAELWRGDAGGQGLAHVAFAPDGSSVAYGSWFRTPERGVIGFVSEWNAANGTEIHRSEFGDKPIVVVAYSPDGRRLAAGTWGWRVAVWGPDRTAAPRELHYDDVAAYSAIDDIAFSPDGTHLAAASKSGLPRIWNLADGERVRDLHGHRGGVFAVAYDDVGFLYSGADDGSIKRWDATTGVVDETFFGHGATVTGLAVSPDGRRLASASQDGTLRLWDPAQGREFSTPGERADHIWAMPATSDGDRIAMSAPESRIAIWDTRSGTVTQSFASGLEDGLNAGGFSPDGRRLVGCNWGDVVRVWNLETGIATVDLDGFEGGSNGCAFSPDGRFIAAGSTAKAVFIWDAATGEPVARLEHDGGVDKPVFSPDMTTLAVSQRDGTLVLWNVADWSRRAAIMAHDGGVWAIGYSRDGGWLATGGEDGEAALRDPATGEAVRRFAGHKQRIWSLAFVGDDRLATGSADRTVRLWDTQTGEQVVALAEFPGGTYSLVYVPHLDRLIVNSSGNSVDALDAPEVSRTAD